MKFPVFSLVYSRRGPAASSVDKSLDAGLGKINKRLQANVLASQSDNPNALREIAKHAESERETAGIWDLGAWVGGLSEIIELMNRAQSGLLFFEVHAAVPASLVSTKQRVIAWGEGKLRRRLKPRERAELTDAIISEEFLKMAERVRRDLGVNYLIALTPADLADTYETGEVVSDLFCKAKGRVSLISTVGLRDLSEKAERRFEYSVGFVMAATLFFMLNRSKVPYHKDNGCLMDEDYDRTKIVLGLVKPVLCEECRKKSKAGPIKIVEALLRHLDRYPRAHKVLEPA